MAVTTYFEDNTPTNLNDLFTVLSNALVAKGWTRTVINSTTVLPTTQSRIGREEVFQSPGDSVDTGGFYIVLQTFRSSSLGIFAIKVWAMTSLGTNGFVPISTVNRSGSTYTIVTTSPHGFSTGDVVHWNGCSEPDYNQANAGSVTSLRTITVIDTTTFTISGQSATATGTATGGTAYQINNMAGNTSNSSASGVYLTAQDTNLDVVGGVDEFAISCTVFQGGFAYFMYVGALGRAHIGAEFSQTFTTTADVTATGATQSISVEETPLNVIVNQPIDLVDNGTNRIYRTQVDAIGPGNAISVTLPIGQNFRAGAKMGWDPMPLVAMGRTTNATATQEINVLMARMAYSIDGTRSWSEADADDIAGDFDEASIALSSADIATELAGGALNIGANMAGDLFLLRESSSGGGRVGRRGPLRNLIVVGNVGITDYEFCIAGRTDPDDVYKVFPTMTVTSSDNMALAYGPNVPGATPL